MEGEEAADRGLQEPLLHFCICEGNQPGVVVWIGKVGMVGVAVGGGYKGLCIYEGCLQGGEV